MNMSCMCVLHLSVCMCACICIPVVFVGEVVYNGGADAGHAPLAVVPSSCDDRELRLTQTLLTFYTERGQRRTKHTQTHTHTEKSVNRSVVTREQHCFANLPSTQSSETELTPLPAAICSCKPQSWTFDTFTHSEHRIIIIIFHVY